MTTATLTGAPRRTATVSPATTVVRAAKAEWVKLRSVRSTMWTLAVLVATVVGIGLLVGVAVSSSWGAMSVQERMTFEAGPASLSGIYLGQLVLGVLAILVVTAEYTTGTIRASLMAVPRRGLFYAAKVLVFTLVALVVAAVTVLGAFLLGQAPLAGIGVGQSLGDPGIARLLTAAVGVLLLLGLFALGLGTLVRNTAAAITAYVGIVFVAPIIANFLPGSWSTTIGKVLPLNLMSITMEGESWGDGWLSPGASTLLLAGWAVLALALGAWRLLRRDA